MKTLIMLIVTAVMTFLTSMLLASEPSAPIKFYKAESLVDHYIDASINGNTLNVDHLFTDDFYFSTPNARSKEKINKKALVKHMKSLTGVQLEAETEYEFVEKNEDCSIVRICSTFKTFKRYDYVTMCNSKDGWKISNVVVTYPDRN